MADIESRDESMALSGEAERLEDIYWHADGGSGARADLRQVIRHAWIAGREWERRRAAIGPVRPLTPDPRALRAVQSGLRLLGCNHPVSCLSVAQCAGRDA